MNELYFLKTTQCYLVHKYRLSNNKIKDIDYGYKQDYLNIGQLGNKI